MKIDLNNVHEGYYGEDVFDAPTKSSLKSVPGEKKVEFVCEGFGITIGIGHPKNIADLRKMIPVFQRYVYTEEQKVALKIWAERLM